MAKNTEPHVDCVHCQARFKSIFCNLSGSELQNINENKWCQQVKKGQVIFSEGAYPHGIFCVSSGKIKIHQMGEEGREQIVRFAGEGDVVGYRALLNNEKYSSSATALDDCSVCFIPKNVFFGLIDQNKELSMQVIRLLSSNLRHAEHTITNLAQKSVRERMAEAILFLKELYGFEEDGKTLAVSLSREEFATMVGTATESAIRLLSEFKSSGLIELKGKKISIINLNGLLQTANIHD